MTNVIWQSQPKQAAFMQRWEDEALYGGAAGGGKSDTLLAEALRQVHIPHYRGILFRKTYPELADLIDRSGEIYKAAFPKAKYNDSKHVWTFPSGAKISFGNMQHRKDRIKYQGRHFDYVGFDELTHFTWDEYSYMISRNRPNGPGTLCYMRGGTNPGGIGHGWVKQRFVQPFRDGMRTMVEKVSYINENGEKVVVPKTRIFVPSTVFDNKKLTCYDPTYIARLASMSQKERDALLYGSWDMFDGQVFMEWRDYPEHYRDRKWTHVIEPFEIPLGFEIIRSLDWGYSKPFSVGWYAADFDGRIYRIRELYGCTGTPDTGIKWEAHQVAKKIREIENTDPNLKGHRIFGIADPAIFSKSAGPSIADDMAQYQIYFRPGSHDRIQGKMQCHYRFAFDNDGRPMFYVFNTCRHFIRTVPSLVYSETDVEDVDTRQEDHIYDEFRYCMMEKPISTRIDTLTSETIRGLDPFDLYRRKNNDRGKY